MYIELNFSEKLFSFLTTMLIYTFLTPHGVLLYLPLITDVDLSNVSDWIWIAVIIVSIVIGIISGIRIENILRSRKKKAHKEKIEIFIRNIDLFDYSDSEQIKEYMFSELEKK